MTIECSQSVHSIDIRPVYYGVQMVICGGKSRFHSVSTWFLGILLCKVKGIGFSNRIRYLAGSLIIPGISEPPARTLRATVPENERHIFR